MFDTDGDGFLSLKETTNMMKDLTTDKIVYKMREDALNISKDRVEDPNATIPGLKIKPKGLCNAKKADEGCMRGYQCGRFSSVRDAEATEKFRAITGICVKSSQCLRSYPDLKP